MLCWLTHHFFNTPGPTFIGSWCPPLRAIILQAIATINRMSKWGRASWTACASLQSVSTAGRIRYGAFCREDPFWNAHIRPDTAHCRLRSWLLYVSPWHERCDRKHLILIRHFFTFGSVSWLLCKRPLRVGSYCCALVHKYLQKRLTV